MKEALYQTTILGQFFGLSSEHIPDETTILSFRRQLEKHELAAGVLGVIKCQLATSRCASVGWYRTPLSWIHCLLF